MARFVLAVRRTMRASAPGSWADRLADISGVQVLSPPGARRVMVEADTDGIAKVRKLLGSFCHIEPLIEHDRCGRT